MNDTLDIGRCALGHTTHPYRPTCPADGDPMAHATIPARGRLLTWTEIARPPTGFEAPLTVGVFLATAGATQEVWVLATLDDAFPGQAPDTTAEWGLRADEDGHVRAAPLGASPSAPDAP